MIDMKIKLRFLAILGVAGFLTACVSVRQTIVSPCPKCGCDGPAKAGGMKEMQGGKPPGDKTPPDGGADAHKDHQH